MLHFQNTSGNVSIGMLLIHMDTRGIEQVFVKISVFWDIILLVESQPTFRRNMSAETNMKLAAMLLHAGFLPCLFFDLEDGDDMFLRNVG
jgi:hypothetical protein